jgi:hypothetical protein
MKVKKRSADHPLQHGKKSKASDDCNARNPAKTRLDDLTSFEIASLLEISESEEIVVRLKHPRVQEHPFGGSLIQYLLGQIKAVQISTEPNLYKSDRFAGLTGFLMNLTSLFHTDAGRGFESLPHFLHIESDLNRRLIAMTVEYFLNQLPDECDGSASASSTSNGDSSQDPSKDENKLICNVINLLTMLNNFILYEARLPRENRFLKKVSMSALIQRVTA